MKRFPLTAEEFARQISSEVDYFLKLVLIPGKGGGSRLWRYAAKRWLDGKAREHGLRAIYTDQQGMSEFLLDLVWWQDGPGGSAVLACEMEWGNTPDPQRNVERVVEDFDKLLSFKAPFKLMLFDSYGDAKIQSDVISELNRYLREYGDHRIGEQYLVMDWSLLESAWVCNIVRDGEDGSLKLVPLEAERYPALDGLES